MSSGCLILRYYACIGRSIFACLAILKVGFLMYDYTCIPYHPYKICHKFENDSVAVSLLSGVNLLLGLIVGVTAYALFSRAKYLDPKYDVGPSGLDWYSGLFFTVMAVLFGTCILNRKPSVNNLSKSIEAISVIVNCVAAIVLVVVSCWEGPDMERVDSKLTPELNTIQQFEMNHISSTPGASPRFLSTEDQSSERIEREIVVEQHLRPGSGLGSGLAAGVTLRVDELESFGNGQMPETSNTPQIRIVPPDTPESQSNGFASAEGSQHNVDK